MKSCKPPADMTCDEFAAWLIEVRQQTLAREKRERKLYAEHRRAQADESLRKTARGMAAQVEED